MFRALFIASAILLTACTSTEQAMSIISPRYHGKSADEFFRENGAPYSQYTMQDGGRIYRWRDGIGQVQMPGTTTFNAYNTPAGMAGTATTWGDSTITITCDLEIHTDNKNRVQFFRVAQDSLGMWQTSRCNEYFSGLASR